MDWPASDEEAEDRISTERSNPADDPEAQRFRNKKRSRVQFSCTACRSRKLKCDRKHPCDRCTRRGDAATCTFVGHGPRLRTTQGTVNPTNVENRIQHLENLILSYVQKKKLEYSPAITSPGSQENDSSGHPSYHSPHQPSIDGSSSGSPDKIFVDEDMSNWRAILEDIKEVKGYVYEKGEESDESDTEPDVDDPSRCSFLFGYGRSPSKEDLLADLPPRAMADRLIARYFSSGDPILVILHFPTFQAEYSHFWQNQQVVSPAWLALLFACLSRAIAVLYRSGDSLPPPFADPAAVMALYRRRSGDCLLLANYTKPGRYKVEGLVLYAGAEYSTARSNADSVNLLIGHAFKLGFRSAYHRDPKNYPNISAMDGEMRRRTWHLMLQLDSITAYQVGVPRAVQSYQYDTEPPGNYADEDFNVNTIKLPEPRPITLFTPASYLLYKGRILEVFAKVVDFVSSPKPDSYDQVLDLDRHLTAVHESAPPFFRTHHGHLSITDTPDLIMKRFTLEYLYLKGRCVLHRKYMTQGQANPRYEYSRWVAVDAAKTILRYQAEIFNESQPCGLLHSNKWFFNSLQEHDLIMAAMIICVELSQNQPADTKVRAPDTGETMVIESRENLSKALETSWDIWKKSLDHGAMGRKAFEALTIMLRKAAGRAHPVSDVQAQMDAGIRRTYDSNSPGQLTAISPSQITPQTISSGSWPPSLTATSDFAVNISEQPTFLGALEGMIEAPYNIDWDAWDDQMEGFEARLTNQSWATNLNADTFQIPSTDINKYWKD